MIYNYYIVPVGWGNIIAITGKNIEGVEKPRAKQYIATVDLDRTFVHFDFNRKKVETLVAEHQEEVEAERKYDMEGWWLLRSKKAGVRVRDLLKKYKIETLREYRHRSRREINEARKKGERV